MSEFYDGNRLLSTKDANGQRPELFFCCGNRTAGKTFFFKRWMVKRFIQTREKFIIFVRFIDDIPQASVGFWADIGPIKYPRYNLTQRPILHGKAAELLLNDQPCGYVIALNDPERIKRNSSIFADAERGFLDEFQSEEGKYCPNEIRKFNSIRLSIARGGARGKHARYFPVYLASNNVTLFNPYFQYLGIETQIQNRTKFLRGDGWVLEQTFNRAAAEAIAKNFKTVSAEELAYATKNEYLLDTNTFVSHVPGCKNHFTSIIYHGIKYTLWSGADGIIFMSKKLKGTCGDIIVIENDDHDEGRLMLKTSSVFLKYLSKAYREGMIRFESQGCKNAFLTFMSIISKRG